MMSSNYSQYEEEVAKCREENKKHLEDFRVALEAKNISPKTIKQHISNMQLYLNHYMQREEATPMEGGWVMVDTFFTWFYPLKCMPSSAYGAKSMMASVKKFYKLMMDKGLIEKDDYQQMLATMKEHREEYLSYYGSSNSSSSSSHFDIYIPSYLPW